MPSQLLIIDGYNLLHASSIKGSLQQRQATLLRELQAQVGTLAEETVVVFDGQGSRVEHESGTGKFSVVYSRKHQTADAVIERMVSRHPDPKQLLVVSSDHAITTMASSRGCSCMRCDTFLSRAADSRSQVRTTMKRSGKSSLGTLGDLFTRDME